MWNSARLKYMKFRAVQEHGEDPPLQRREHRDNRNVIPGLAAVSNQQHGQLQTEQNLLVILAIPVSK
jgi:hypothetical protein